VFLALVMVPSYWGTVLSLLAYLLIVALTCLTTANLALMCSTLFHKTSTSLVVTYMLIVVLFLAPVAADYFAQTYFANTPAVKVTHAATMASPFAAAHQIPLFVDSMTGTNVWARASFGDKEAVLGYRFVDLVHFGGYLVFTLFLNMTVFLLMVWMFHSRWRVSSSNR
jgi:hypothetical protein